jgi:hypothetical protein
MNIERIYTTTLSAEDIAQALAAHFRAKDFDTQIFGTSNGGTAMQARKESLWRQALGVAYAMTVVITPHEDKLNIDLGGHEWVDTAVSAGIGLVAVPPVLLGTVYGIWRQNRLDQEVWQVIETRVEAAEPQLAPVSGAALATDGPLPSAR